jgi:hypothetical protein
MSRDSSVGIALGYGLDDRGSRVRFPEEAGNFSLHHRVQNGSGAHPASYPMGTRGFFPGDNFTIVEVSIAVKLFTETGLLALRSNPLPGGVPFQSPFTTCMGYSGTILFPGHHTGSLTIYSEA